jgi:glucose/arabinose dehydrogenase
MIRALAGTILAGGLLVSVLTAELEAQLRTRVHVSGLEAPLAFVRHPSLPSVYFVAEQAGRIRAVTGGALEPDDFLDLSSAVRAEGERGLLGLAFSPDYAASGRFYVNFTNTAGDTVIARFRRSSNPLVADSASRFDLRWGSSRTPSIAQPFGNHNGGHLAFGPDGYLYIGLGDGGSGNDPHHHAQNPASLLGKFLRIDVNVPDDHPAGYVVPADNPFLGGHPIAALPEIWSFGVRNPWRYSFDDPALGGTGALVMGDVGQGAREEINYEPAGRGGRNYGWRNREGTRVNVETLPPAYQPLIDPVHEYDRAAGQSVTGGYVYRGGGLGGYHGRYFFADFIAGRVWSLGLSVDPASRDATAFDLREHTEELGGRAFLGNISSFGVDAEGELYIVSHSHGRVLQVESTATTPAQPPPVPRNLRIIRPGAQAG